MVRAPAFLAIVALTIGRPGSCAKGRRDNDAGTIGDIYIPMCCEPGQWSIESRCEENDSSPPEDIELPPIHNSKFAISDMRPNVFTHKYGWPCGIGDPGFVFPPKPHGNETFWLLENASLVIDYPEEKGGPELYDSNQYCWGSVMDKSVGPITAPVVCFGSSDSIPLSIVVKPMSIILSIPFFCLTIIAYCTVSELKTFHGSTFRTYIACLLVGYVSLSVINGKAMLGHDITSWCIGIALLMYFAFQASFFWLNVMCFDIWWTFGGFRAIQGSVKQRDRKKFICYSIYAWGSATVLTVICAIMHHLPNLPKGTIVPDFNDDRCWFKSAAARFLYFYLSMAITVTCNIFFFISTALKIKKHKNDTSNQLKGTESRRHDDNKQWFNLYLKLSIVMGINWTFEILSWYCGDKPKYLFICGDLINSLQGVTIFIIFVWKPKIRRSLLKRCGCSLPGIHWRTSSKSSNSRTLTTLQDKTVPRLERYRSTTEDSECI